MDSKAVDIQKKSFGKKLLTIVREFIHIPLAALLAYLLFGLIFMIGYVPTSSMEPNYEAGCMFFGTRMVEESDFETGDPIIFQYSEDVVYFKRVIGTPGDVVSFEDGKVFINDKELDESAYLDASVRTTSNHNKRFTVPEDCYFVMGDNRDNSYDSRFWPHPYVKFEDVIAKPVTTAYVPVLSDNLKR